ncbi:hypothetical protein EV132_103314 [Rhizobium sullae]|uniref:Uncharacterized protein n=1 Tax=Rhizobium sullae TaxID=50338 RepID=A0A4R3QBP9_RHISU|nr:hypothetical protein EV132_103314 [Rhizobium sullae]
MIGRVQAFTTLFTDGFGLVIYLLSAILPGASEATLYMACGSAVVINVGSICLQAKGRLSRKS